jgi:hypothetical protein
MALRFSDKDVDHSFIVAEMALSVRNDSGEPFSSMRAIAGE